ncbi:MAG: hypothetical protein A2W35_11775 [Chloroflexi bacterium RBG_16_57_11]|nr:MAG: hypothetical protein A2W35_11775 [Chloroflexi bacterium RBG_16_57_11]
MGRKNFLIMYNPGMDSRSSPPAVRSFLLAALILMLLGWGGLAYVISRTEPSGGTRWAFFFTSVLGLTGVALPIVAYLNRRFPSVPPPSPAVIVRQAIWIGIYFPTLAWLRIGRVVNLSLALLLAAGLILIEFLLRLRERSQWKPESRP